MSIKLRKTSAMDTEEDDSDEEEAEGPDENEDHNMIRFGVIADEEITIGLLLTGVGYCRDNFRNYLIVDRDTKLDEVENFFYALYRRPCIGLILIDYLTAKRLHHVLDKCKKVLPVIVILPTKGCIISYMEEKERQRRQRQRDLSYL
ncbi:PREDICTED: V-type proton ATPase subunit F [Drosophila arizonae]|uniref:V-type proton ATPase subunit F n=1 Tax=Drosophila arizonae TaxID=7263 RepID=A0ABM1PW86_DROAR|nr:PREDICTED: V-type proton ATPase subunit F [Drosophila arizonae]